MALEAPQEMMHDLLLLAEAFSRPAGIYTAWAPCLTHEKQ